jgi:hypothetical protein
MSQYVRPGESAGTNPDVVLIGAPAPGSISGINPIIVGGPLTQIVAYTHTQSISSNTWVINHGLNFFPNVTVADSSGAICEGEIAYTNNDSLTITFTGAFSGKAYLS